MKTESLYKKFQRAKARQLFQQSGQLPASCKHGTHQAYNYYSCRCTPCCVFHNSYLINQAKSKPIQHGLYGYKWQGCKCGICFAAGRRYREQQKVAA